MWATLVRAQSPDCAWCHGASVSAPDVAVRVLAHFPVGRGRVLEEIEFNGHGWGRRIEELKGRPRLHGLILLESTPDHARIRIEIDECPLRHAVSVSSALPRFPFEVKDGSDEWLLISERDQADRFVKDLRGHGVKADIVSSREYHPHASLTDRQREMMEAAIDQGYYEVPRRVTLTHLAERLHVAKSTLSETLARGERHLLEGLNGPK